jgi:hypothetical protein
MALNFQYLEIDGVEFDTYWQNGGYKKISDIIFAECHIFIVSNLWPGVSQFKCTLPISPFAISPHYNTSCKLVICASLFFYEETPGYEAGRAAFSSRKGDVGLEFSCKFKSRIQDSCQVLNQKK